MLYIQRKLFFSVISRICVKKRTGGAFEGLCGRKEVKVIKVFEECKEVKERKEVKVIEVFKERKVI